MIAPCALAVATARSTEQADGIRDYTEQLVAQLRVCRPEQIVLYARQPGPWNVRFVAAQPPQNEREDERLRRSWALVLQYNPFSHGRWGFAPGLALTMLGMRCRRSRPVIALMVHETFVDPDNWRWLLMRTWQRCQLRALQLCADVVFCTIERWSEDMRRSWPPAPVHHLPVASNLPDRRGQRDAVRAKLGVHESGLVFCAFGLDHVGRLTDHIVDAAAAAARAGRAVTLLGLGTGPRRRELIRPGVTLHTPGYLPDDEVAALLASADLFLAPYADGVSTRRTTVMAALQHEVAVVGTDGHLTDSALRDATHALRLVAVDDHDAYVAAACDLVAHPDARRALAAAGRRLYEERFDWPVLAERLLGVLEDRRRP